MIPPDPNPIPATTAAEQSFDHRPKKPTRIDAAIANTGIRTSLLAFHLETSRP
jgi:hypothetical protein